MWSTETPSALDLLSRRRHTRGYRSMQGNKNTARPYTSTPIAELAMQLAQRGMDSTAVNLRALGANPDAADYWETWCIQNKGSAVTEALRKVKEAAK